ncbi:MAG: citramalate synthase [Myxococcales bacterium]|nr:citramalate synthase [Myxococcales bacterium]
MVQEQRLQIEIFDTTLRDGAQTEGISFSCEDKIRIARRLDRFGIALIEAGWPGSNPKDAEFFHRSQGIDWKNSQIVAFGATRRKGLAAADDENLQRLVEVNTSVCTLVGKTWTLHVDDVLRVSRDENLRMIEESISFLQSHGRRIIFDAEHFFDGYAADSVYALEALQAAVRGGADTLTLCDTNGGSLPWIVEDVVARVVEACGVRIGIHCHNDGELAVANSMAAVRGGARHLQGTINGLGERCGNTNLCSVIPNLQLKMGYHCVADEAIVDLFDLAHYAAEVANVALDEQRAYVGKSAFAHKGGIHVAAMRRNATSYQHIEPELVGNKMRVVVSELSGRGNLHSKVEELGLTIDDGVQVDEVLGRIKAKEAEGFAFEAAEASIVLMLARESKGYKAPFSAIEHTVFVENRSVGVRSQAMVKLDVAGQIYHTAGEAIGPVEALDIALRAALLPRFSALENVSLVDYKVRILDAKHSTRAITRVLIDSHYGEKTWSTVGASSNVIEASWMALLDSYEYGLTQVISLLGDKNEKLSVVEEVRA